MKRPTLKALHRRLTAAEKANDTRAVIRVLEQLTQLHKERIQLT